MAIYHCSVKIIGRSSGRSSVASAAYRAGEKLQNERDGVTHDFSHRNSVAAAAYRSGDELEHDGKTHNFSSKKGVVYSEIMLPENAPTEYKDRSTLWNAVEKAEKRKDAQTAREVEVALPIELDLQEQVQILHDYIKENFVDNGMCADFSIHDKNDGNPHAHIMLTTRNVDKDGFTNKNREWNKAAQLEKWRENWAEVCNREFERKGLDIHIDHRTLEEQGIEREPTIHVGRSHERAAINQEIIKRNEFYTPAKMAEFMRELKESSDIIDRHLREFPSKNREITILDRQIAEISRRKAVIDEKEAAIEQANAELKNTKLWQTKNKQRIKENLEYLTRSNGHARNYFKQTFKIEPEAAEQEIQRMKEQSAALRNEIKTNEKLVEIKNEFMSEYQELRLLEKATNPMEQTHFDMIYDMEPSRAEILREMREEKIRTRERERSYERSR
ncbi:MAG: MobA/MobL family protein [Oscillospiraceae bacterium]|nr:MobA/MobL family protein [Oscillospiraceae bacterium]